MWLWIFTIIVVLYCSYRLLEFWIFTPWRIHRDFWAQGIPGRYKPIVGEVFELRDFILADDPMSYGRKMFNEFGHYYHASFGPVARFVTIDPSLIQGVLKTNARFYHKSPVVNLVLRPILDRDSLLLAEDNVHARHRRLIAPMFQQQNIVSMIPLMSSIISDFLKKWSLAIDDGKNQNNLLTLEVHKEMSLLTLDIIVACAFGSDMMKNEDARRIVSKSVTTYMENIEIRTFNMTAIIPILNQLPLPSKLEIDRAKTNIKHAAQQMINQRKQGLTKSSCKGSDLLDLLLNAQDSDTGNKFTDKELVEEALTFVLAGHETTATLMTWVLFDLANNLDVYHRLEAEVDSVLNDNEEITMSTLSLLNYTELVLKESLRFHPPAVFLSRIAIEENTLVASDGKRIRIKKGADILIDVFSLHHSEKYWDRPEEYDPTRFNKNYTDIFLPFSSGFRSCIGQNFAMLEAKLLLAMLVKRFHFELVPGQKHVPSITVTQRPKYGMWMKVSQR